MPAVITKGSCENDCGFARRDGYGPTRYPVSCSPQAWATGAPFLLIQSLLGLHLEAEQHRLTLDQPTLPDWLKTLEINGIYLGARRVHRASFMWKIVRRSSLAEKTKSMSAYAAARETPWKMIYGFKPVLLSVYW